MNFDELIQAMTPDIFTTMKTAVELGKWPDGSVMTSEQKEVVIQAILVYDAQQHNVQDEPFRVRADGSVKLGKEKTASELKFNADTIITKNKV